MSDPRDIVFPLAGLPTTERAHNAIIGALVDVVLTLPDLPPEVVARLMQLREPGIDFAAAIRISHDLSAVCRAHQARLGRS